VPPPLPDDKTVVSSGDPHPTIGGYRLLKEIGSGGAGKVYAAEDEALGRQVAIKLLHPQLARDATQRERFQREARAMATVRTPHVAAVYSIGEERGRPYIVMEYFEGANLEVRVQQSGRLGVEEALIYARDCALALQAADGEGIVHRDVKPANIVVKDGRAILTDFGLARPMDGSANMTIEGEVAGTAMFMSPDRITGQGDDRRADIYSLGATLYCLVAGHPPFERPNAMDVITAHINEEPEPLTDAAPGTSPRVADLVKRMMAKNPQRRQQTYDELIGEMNALISGGGDEVDSGLIDEPTEVHGIEAVDEAPDMTSAEVALDQANDPFGAPPGDTSDDSPFAADPVTGAVGMPTGVMGTLTQMGVVDICHMLEMGKKDAVIELHSTDGLAGRLCFLEGHVSYCTWGDISAQEAFYELCRRKDGFFRIHYGRRQEERNIEGQNQFLLLEAMRHIDDVSRAMPVSSGAAARPPMPTKKPSLDLPSLESAPDVTIPQGEPVMSDEGFPTSPFGAPPQGASAASSLPSPPAPPGAPAPLRPGPPVGLPPNFSRRGLVDVPAPVPTAPVPTAPRAPAPVDVPTVMAAALLDDEEDGEDDVVGDTASESAPRDSTLIWTADEEKAMRAAQAGQPGGGAGGGLREAWNEQLRPALEPVIAGLLDVNERAAAALSKNANTASLGQLVRDKPAVLPAAAAVAVLGVFFFALMLLVVIGGREPAADAATLSRIDSGDAAQVLGEIDAIPDHERTAVNELERGHALAKLGQRDSALGAYRRAQALGLTDRRAMNVALGELEAEQPTVALEYLISFSNGAVTSELRQMTRSAPAQRRHHALFALESRGELEEGTREDVAILDLLTNPTCKDRREGLLELRKVGRSKKARAAFDKALLLKDTDNACMKRELSQMIAD